MLRRNLMVMGDLAVPGLMATAPCPSKSHRLLTGSSVDTAIGSIAVLVRAAIAVASFWASTFFHWALLFFGIVEYSLVSFSSETLSPKLERRPGSGGRGGCVGGILG